MRSTIISLAKASAYSVFLRLLFDDFVFILFVCWFAWLFSHSFINSISLIWCRNTFVWLSHVFFSVPFWLFLLIAYLQNTHVSLVSTWRYSGKHISKFIWMNVFIAFLSWVLFADFLAKHDFPSNLMRLISYLSRATSRTLCCCCCC